MSKVSQIEEEIASLSPAEVRSVARWLEAFLSNQWDKDIEEDARAGKLDFLFEEAEAEREARTLRAWPDDNL